MNKQLTRRPLNLTQHYLLGKEMLVKQLQRPPLRFVAHYLKEKKHIIKLLHRRPLKFVKHYLNELAYYLSEKAIQRLKIAGQCSGIILLTAIITFISLSNIEPFGITIQYAMGEDTTDISQLGPRNRVQTITVNGQQANKVTDDLVYFNTNMPFNFDSAIVKVWYQNPNPDQNFSLGFQDQSEWHYTIKPLDAPFLNSLTWTKTGSNPVLYQRNKTYNSVSAFLKNPPKYSIIGTYEYDSFDGGIDQTHLASYKPQKKDTVISTVLRGSQTLYVYLDHEPLHLSFEKQDLNWYPGPDPVTVNVYKGNDLVYQVTSLDNKISTSSAKISPPKTVDVNNPGPGLPDSGVYKIVIVANDDTIIKNIRSNLHKIVFSGSLFLAGNSDAYRGAVASTSATTLYTNALSLSATTYHPAGEQQILVGNQTLNLSALQIPQIITPQENITKIIIPKNDVVLNAFEGYFAFSPDQLFSPTKYYTLPITTSDDASLANYILTDYSPPLQENGLLLNEQTFNLHTAYIQNNQLSWVIELPHLKENHHTIFIKDIQVTFHKNAIL